jgi:hypothetical protein
VGVVLVAGVLTSGCALVNPHVRWTSPVDPVPKTITDGIRYADAAKDAYKGALGHQSKLASWLGIGLIPLGAAALGLGMTGGSPAAVTALGLAGAAGFGTGTWLQSRPNQRAWVAGYNATTCAVEAVRPLLYVEWNRDAIDKATTALDVAIAKLDTSLGKARAELLRVVAERSTPLDDRRDLGRDRVAEAASLRTAAFEARRKAEQMVQEAATGGISLKEAVDRISGQVSAQLVEAGPDLQALAGIVRGLAGSYGQFVSVPESLRSKQAAGEAQGASDATIKAINSLSQAVGELETAMLEVETATRRVADIVNNVTNRKLDRPLADQLSTCGVTEPLVAALTLDPAGAIAFAGGKPASAARLIRGGAAPWLVEAQGDSVEGLSIKKGDLNSPAFVVQITAKTPEGEYPLLIADKTGQRMFAIVSVGSGAGAAGDTKVPPNTGAVSSPLAPAAAELSKTPPPSVELPNVNVTITRAEVAGTRILLDVIVRAKNGPTTTAIVDAVQDSAIADEVLKLKVVKDNGVSRRDQIAIRSKKAAP